MTSTEVCVSHGGPEHCGGTDGGRTGEPGKAEKGEEESADENKTSETTCKRQIPVVNPENRFMQYVMQQPGSEFEKSSPPFHSDLF